MVQHQVTSLSLNLKELIVAFELKAVIRNELPYGSQDYGYVLTSERNYIPFEVKFPLDLTRD